MKHILDSEFRYRPSFDTDVRKTFEKVRRQQQVREHPPGVSRPVFQLGAIRRLRKK